MKVAFHIDQLWFSAPGGIGTYVRELAPALMAEDPTLELMPFRTARMAGDGPPATWVRRMPEIVQVPGTIRALYPRWALTGRPALPRALATG